MKTIMICLSIMLFGSLSFADGDVCCVMSKVSGNNVNTFADFKSENDCKKGQSTTTNTGAKQICSVLSADDPSCSDRSMDAKKKRCSQCGFQWVDDTCVVENLSEKSEELEKEKQELEKEKKSLEEEKEQEKARKDKEELKKEESPQEAPEKKNNL